MRTFLVVSLSLFAFACGNKSSGGSGSGAGTGSDPGSGAGQKTNIPPPPGEKPIALPKSDGTPLKPAGRSLGPNDWKRMAAIDHPPFLKRIRNTKTGFDVRFTTERPKIGTTVTITDCLHCVPMNLDAWKAKTDDLKYILGDDLRDRPDTTWEIGSKEIHGTLVIWTYQVGHFFGKDDNGNPHASYSDAYALYFNDGDNQIRVVSEYQDSPVSREEMLAVAPREDLEQIATAFMDFYAHDWDKPTMANPPDPGAPGPGAPEPGLPPVPEKGSGAGSGSGSAK